MKARNIVVAAIATTALAMSVATPALAAAPAAPSGSLTIYAKETQRSDLDLGGSGTTVGDIVTGSGTTSFTKGGKSIGTFAYNSETVLVAMPGGNASRINNSFYKLPGGAIMIAGLWSAQQGTQRTNVQPLVIVGGTGKYAGANGTATLVPKGKFYEVTFVFTS